MVEFTWECSGNIVRLRRKLVSEFIYDILSSMTSPKKLPRRAGVDFTRPLELAESRIEEREPFFTRVSALQGLELLFQLLRTSARFTALSQLLRDFVLEILRGG